MNWLTYIGCISLCGTLFALIPSVCGQESGGGSKLPQKAAVLEASGPWQVKVTTEQHGITTTSQLDVCPPETLAVTDENHGVLKPWSLGGYFWDSPAIAGLTDGPNTGMKLLVPGSMLVREEPGDGPVFTIDVDYQLDSVWGRIGRIEGGRIRAEQPVYLSYRFHRQRLDSVVRTSDGQIRLRTGIPHISTPLPAEPEEGEIRLATIWLPIGVRSLGPENLFRVNETRFPEPAKASPPVAEKLLPKSLEKLRGGEPLRILAWGDSVTEGYLGEDQWQLQFKRLLEQRFQKAKIEMITVGWGAHNSNDFLKARAGTRYNFAERVLAAKPDLVVSLFVNDANSPVALVEENYSRLRKDFMQIGAEWIIVSPHYSTFTNPVNDRHVDDDPRPYVRMLRRFAPANDIPLADAAARYGRLWMQGLPYPTVMVNAANHPDARGMRIFADSLMHLLP